MGRTLRYSVPNPPAVFVGRHEELAWLGRRLRDFPLAVVGGPDGIGKSALAFELLRRTAQDRTVVRVAVRPGDPSESLMRHLLWALSEPTGRRVDAPGRARVPEDATSAVLELAEASSAVVLVEDLQHVVSSEDAHELVVQLASFARTSRWLFTTTKVPRDTALAGSVLSLEGLSENDLVELGAGLEHVTDAKRDRTAARLAGGSPWVFLQLRARGLDVLDEARATLLDGVSPEGRQLLETAVALRHSIEAETLLIACGAGLASLKELAGRGLMVEVEGGWRAHDAARAVVGAPSGGLGSVAARLGDSDRPLAWIEALRIHLLEGADDAATSLMQRRGETLLASGEAPRVWSVISTTTQPGLEAWRLRCAAELGNHTVLAAAKPARRPVGGLEWAEMLRLMGDPRTALSDLAAVADEPEARRLRARCSLALGEVEEALRRLDELGDRSPIREWAASILGEDALASSPPADDRERIDAARAAWWRGERDRAEALIRQVTEGKLGADMSLVLAREARLLHAWFAVDAGRLADAQDDVEALRPFVRGPTSLRGEWSALDAEIRLLRGPLRKLEEDIEDALPIAEESDAHAHWRLAACRDRWRSLSGHPPLGSSAGPMAGPDWRYALDDVLLGLRARLTAQPAEVADEARALARAADQSNLPTVECEALLVACDAIVSGGGDATSLARALLDRATAIGAARLIWDARLLLARDDVGEIEHIAAAGETSPRAARRAQAQLDPSVIINALDSAVVDLGAQPSIETLPVTASAGVWAAGWGIDEEAQVVWFSDRPPVQLAKRPMLLTFLTTLHEAGGSATKEELIQRVWEQREYHPGRHDPKLFVAVRSLRQLIEPDPASPRYLLTATDGYELARPVRRRRA